MKVTYCPYCLNTTIVEDRAWGGMVQCEAPRCERFFPTVKPGSGSDPLVHAVPVDLVTSPLPVATYGPAGPPVLDLPRSDAPTRLTGPHRCPNCYRPDDPLLLGEIHEPYGRRRWTVTHKNPYLPAPCRTDVYAAIYRCPACLTMLETPRHQWGQQVNCPVESCRHVFTAPRDDLLHRHVGDAREGVPFVFPCGGCGGSLRCDTLRDGQPTTGMLAVCVHCNHVVHVPASGKQFVRSPSVLDPIQAVQRVPERRCRGCSGMVPANAVPCPLCGHPEFDDVIVV
jgi:hypothetical protein